MAAITTSHTSGSTGRVYYHTEGSSGDVVITVAAVPGQQLSLNWADWLTSIQPAAGSSLKVESPSGTTIYRKVNAVTDLRANWHEKFSPPIVCATNTAMVVTWDPGATSTTTSDLTIHVDGSSTAAE